MGAVVVGEVGIGIQSADYGAICLLDVNPDLVVISLCSILSLEIYLTNRVCRACVELKIVGHVATNN